MKATEVSPSCLQTRGAAAEAEVNADEGTGEDDAAWAAGEGDGLGPGRA